MAINRRGRQRGFVLVTVIFLILVGALLIAGMAFLYGTADTQQEVQNGGAQAFMTAESSDQYGVHWLETTYANTILKNRKTVTVSPLPLLFPADCTAVVTIPPFVKKNGVYTYTVRSVVAGCASSGAARTVVRTVTATQGPGAGGPGGGRPPGGGGPPPGGPGAITYHITDWSEG
ncbi:MAG: hypothetical protein ACYCXG_06770 [Acidiferrobacter sp.]